MQSSDIDGAIILEYTNVKKGIEFSDYFEEDFPVAIRPSAPFALHEAFDSRDIPSTVINYANWWEVEDLFPAITNWLDKNNIKYPIVCVSSLGILPWFESSFVLQKQLQKLKQHTDFMFIMGGPQQAFPIDNELVSKDAIFPDYVFSGRALHMFEHWLDGEQDLEEIFVPRGKLKIIRPPTTDIVEEPLVPKLYEDYCLDKHDVINIELRIGCKFNCTFCSFDYRGAKDPKTAKAEELFTCMQEAKTKYGITNFSLADDTINEDNEKLEILLEATRQLDYKPYLGGFLRFDILMRKQEQLEMLEEAGVHTMFYGIESFHEDANKVIRKRLKRSDIESFLRHIKETYPHWRAIAATIVGLPEEPLEHVLDVYKTNARERLIHNIVPYPLQIDKTAGMISVEGISDFAADPEKYGIKIEGTNIDSPLSTETYRRSNWRHKYADSRSAEAMSVRLMAYNKTHGIFQICPWQHIVNKAHGFDTEQFYKTKGADAFKELKLKENARSVAHIDAYKIRKIDYLKS